MRIKVFYYMVIIALLVTPCISAADTIQVLSATVKDKPIPNAKVIFQKNGEKSVHGVTDAKGKASVTIPYNTIDTSTILIIKANGYSTLIVKCPCDGLTYALSETMTQLDGMRIVLSWGAHPLDMDGHLIYGKNHIYFNNTQGEDAWLDVDSRQGFGPETITIGERITDQNYIYAVHTFLDDSRFERTVYDIPAKVQVYVGSSLVRTYYFQPGKPHTLRYLFGINEYGEIYDMYDVVSNVFGEQDVAATLGVSLKKNKEVVRQQLPSSTDHSLVTRNDNSTTIDTRLDKGLAKEANAKGEKAYHSKKLDEAIELYKEAIEYDPNYSQAYSNLGLAYQKRGLIAEALWANRKAIILSEGKNKKTVRASSYYNIARIYESQGKLEKALRSYLWADLQKSRETYKKAIERIKSKMKQ